MRHYRPGCTVIGVGLLPNNQLFDGTCLSVFVHLKSSLSYASHLRFVLDRLAAMSAFDSNCQSVYHLGYPS